MFYINPTMGPGVGWRSGPVRVPIMNRTGGTRTVGQLGAFAHDTTRGDAADVTNNNLDGSLTSGFGCLVALAAADVIHGFVARFDASTADNAEGMATIYSPSVTVSVEDTAANSTLKLPLVIDTAQNANGLTADPAATTQYGVFGYSLEATSTGTALVATLFNGLGWRTYTTA